MIHNQSFENKSIIVNAKVDNFPSYIHRDDISTSISHGVDVPANQTVRVLMLKPLITGYPNYEVSDTSKRPDLEKSYVKVTLILG